MVITSSKSSILTQVPAFQDGENGQVWSWVWYQTEDLQPTFCWAVSASVSCCLSPSMREGCMHTGHHTELLLVSPCFPEAFLCIPSFLWCSAQLQELVKKRTCGIAESAWCENLVIGRGVSAPTAAVWQGTSHHWVLLGCAYQYVCLGKKHVAWCCRALDIKGVPGLCSVCSPAA